MEGIQGYVPPLGLLYLNEILKQEGLNSWVVDMDADSTSLESLGSLIERYKITTVGITVFTRTRKNSYFLSKGIKKRLPHLFMVMGGAHCTLLPQDVLEHSGADLVVQGEAEDVITQIVEEKPRGILKARVSRGLDDLPWPNREAEFIDPSLYGNLMKFKFSSRTGVISSSRGCPFKCSYCMRVGLVKYRERSPQSVVQELKGLYEKGYNGAIFNDDNFLVNANRAIQIAGLIVKEGIKMDFAMQGSPVPSEELWASLHEANFVITCMGVEHHRPEIIKYFNKPAPPERWEERIVRTMEILNKYSFLTCGSFILGAPEERREDALDLIRLLTRNGFDLKNSNELLFSYGTQLWHDAVQKGLFSQDRLHVRASQLMPEKKEYLEEMFGLAWRESVKRIPHIIKKLLSSNKRDKKTPVTSLIRWILKSRFDLLHQPPKQGYGQLDETDEEVEYTDGIYAGKSGGLLEHRGY